MSLALIPAPALLAETQADRFARYAVNNARLLGLTPAGTALWANHIQRVGDWREWQRLTEIEAEVGRQLAQEGVDWRLLERLASEHGVERGRAARVRRQGTVDTALQLTGKDRKAIGAFLKRQSQQRRKPATLPPKVLQTVSEVASNFYRSFGLSAEGTEMLIEAARDDGASGSAWFGLEEAIGEQLSQENPDPGILSDLVARLAAEEARLARSEKSDLIRVASQLTPSDRQRFGNVLRDAAIRSLNDTKPVLEIVP